MFSFRFAIVIVVAALHVVVVLIVFGVVTFQTTRLLIVAMFVRVVMK